MLTKLLLLLPIMFVDLNKLLIGLFLGHLIR